ncbi:helix-turn-helix domain-containing protein [Dawidia soli]|uniref:HTH domain-containing protein n=1 Tax=Dawidia soli TaxID=2782352 RepID=A0AAP2DCV4_9BACT|nr:helix-turn-helix domain-containing protein [Dawidia soli]MBT1689703.1 HTH domain-containing protein [Dawidia soli]
MNFTEQLKRLKRVDYYIHTGTGTADFIASKMGISRRTFFNDLQKLRDMGAEIDFDKSRKCYRYGNNFTLR